MTTPYIEPNFEIEPLKQGRLNGLSFAAKDLFEIKGHTASLGNPQWRATHQPSATTSSIIKKLLNEGARLKGITITDEFMWSIKGDNVHFGAPLNAKVPDSFIGGSSSGSASAVACGDVDFALGTDTGGSIRVPASYSGLFGIRPTHRSLSSSGVFPLAQSFDTVGFFTREISTMSQISSVFFQESVELPQKFCLIQDAFDTVEQPLNEQIIDYFSENFSESFQYITLPEQFKIENLLNTYKLIQSIEAYQNYGEWYKKNKEKAHLGKDIESRFEWASHLTKDEAYQNSLDLKKNFTIYLETLVNQSLLILPSATSFAPQKSSSFDTVEAIRSKTMAITSIAGLAGLPQLSIPVTTTKRPIGLSIIGPKNSEKNLIQFANTLLNQ